VNGYAFFLQAVEQQAQDALNRADRLIELQADYLHRVTEKRASPLLHRMVDQLFVSPSITT